MRDLSASVVAAAARRPASVRVVALPEQLQRSGESAEPNRRTAQIAPKAQCEVLNPVAATTKTNWVKAAVDLARAKPEPPKTQERLASALGCSRNS